VPVFYLEVTAFKGLSPLGKGYLTSKHCQHFKGWQPCANFTLLQERHQQLNGCIQIIAALFHLC
jgi:hypothetical protein